MKNLELILPFSIPAKGLEKDLQKALNAPALSRLISRARRVSQQMQDDFARALPHEYLLAGDFPPANPSNSPASSWNAMHALNLSPESGYWFLLQPVHIHIARDHLVLTDPRRLDLSETESRTLFAIAETVAQEFGLALRYGSAGSWFVRADAWADLRTATIGAACGHNIDIWMPEGEQARRWRQFQNEIQMLWFSHAINQKRESEGQPVINSIWISNGSATAQACPREPIMARNFHELQTQTQAMTNTVCIVIDDLTEAAINNDWGSWLATMHNLETDWFAPLLAAVERRDIGQLDIVASDARQVARFQLNHWSLKKFWIQPSLHQLFELNQS